MKPFKTFILYTVALVLLTSLFWSGCSPKPPEHGFLFLIEVQTNRVGGVVQENTVAATQYVLSKRLSATGIQPTLEVTGSNMLQIKLSTTNSTNISLVRRLIMKTGFLEFRLVHEDSDWLLKSNAIPPGYEIKNETRTLRDGTTVQSPCILNKLMIPGLTSQQFEKVSVMRNSTGMPEIAFAFSKEGAAVFASLTETNVGRRLAILIDGEIHSAPVIRSAIVNGKGIISGGSMQEKEVFELANLLQYSLPAKIRIIEERPF